MTLFADDYVIVPKDELLILHDNALEPLLSPSQDTVMLCYIVFFCVDKIAFFFFQRMVKHCHSYNWILLLELAIKPLNF